MSYDGFNVTDAGTLAAIKGVAGYGYGNFAGDGSAVKAAVDSTSESLQTHQITNAINGNARDAAIVDRVVTGNQFLSDRISAQDTEFRFNSLQNQIATIGLASERSRSDIMTELLKCCCETRSAIASVDAKVECNRQVAEARIAGLNEAKLDAILANGQRPGNS